VEITCRVYRPRDPRKTPVYGLLESLYERVKGAWEERFERSCGLWRSRVGGPCPVGVHDPQDAADLTKSTPSSVRAAEARCA